MTAPYIAFVRMVLAVAFVTVVCIGLVHPNPVVPREIVLFGAVVLWACYMGVELQLLSEHEPPGS
jgi:hypothetical protein